MSLLNDYQTLSRTRHSSAHNAASNVATADLQSNIQAAILIGIVVDVLATRIGAAYLKARAVADLTLDATSLMSTFRFIDRQTDGSWLERATESGKAVKRYPDEAAARIGAANRAGNHLIVCRDVLRNPIALV